MFKKLFLVLLVIISCSVCSSCVLATSKAIISAPEENVHKAFKEVAKELNIETRENVEIVYIWGSFQGLWYKSKYIENPSFYFSKEGTNPLNDTGFLGTFKTAKVNILDTRVECTVGTEAADPSAISSVLINLTRQEIDFQKGLLSPAINEQKSKATYSILNCISPIISTEYLLKNNPLIGKKMRNYARLQNSLGDAILLSSIIGSHYVPKNEKPKLLAGGVIFGLLWRAFAFLNLTDLNDYNELAKSKYHIKLLLNE